MDTSARAALVLLTTLTTFLLAGCSGDSEPDATPSSTATSSEAPATAAAEGVISPADLPADPRFGARTQGVIKDVTVEQCDTEPGDVTASGTATNSGTVARDMVVTVSWTVGATGDVVAKAIATVDDLAPGDTADWDVEATVPGSTTAACVPTALAGQLKG